MGCCESTPVVPDVILPNPQGECKFVTKSCSMFNSDYEVYRDHVGTDNRWLFLNKVGKMFEDEAKIKLENYVRGHNPADPNEGQVLWTVHYDERPDYKQEYDSDSDSDDGMDFSRYFSVLNGHARHTMALKFKMKSVATFVPGIGGGQRYTLKCKAKGTAEREVYYTYDGEGNRQREFRDECEVKKISCKVYDEAGNKLDKFKCYQNDYNWGRDQLQWDCAAFTSHVPGGWGTKEDLVVQTKPGSDPSMALLMAHVVATEFNPGEIASDFNPDWHSLQFMPYRVDYDSD